jgi:hypothetical protein
MTDLTTFLTQIRRPKLLVRAARMGLQTYRAERDLSAVFSTDARRGDRVRSLIEREQQLEDGRLSGDSAYSIQSHVGVLIALLAEARMRGATA